MNITKTITEELAQDVQEMLRHYLTTASEKNKQSFASIAGKLLTGSELGSSEKANIAKTGMAASLAVTTLSMVTGISASAIEFMTPTAAGQSFDGIVTAYGIGLVGACASLALNSIRNHYKEATITNPEIKALVADEDITDLTISSEKMSDALAKLGASNPSSLDEVKQLAWLFKYSDEIRSSSKPMEYQYDNVTGFNKKPSM